MRHKFSIFPLYKKRVNDLISERLLVYKAKKKDKKAFAKLYLKHADSIYRYVFFRVNRDIQQAEDITQEVFFRAWGKIDSLRDEKVNFRAWIFRIAHNLVIDYYRGSKNETGLNENIPDHKHTEEKNLEKLDQELLLSAIEKLTHEQKEVIVMKFIEGFSVREISKVIKKKEIAVRAIQYRGLKKLKKLLK